MSRALSGVRVVELASWTYVPAAGVALADRGAEVIKAESVVGEPGWALVAGGFTRQAARADADSILELSNRGKRSIALDLKTHTDREFFVRLLAEADVLLTSWLPAAPPLRSPRSAPKMPPCKARPFGDLQVGITLAGGVCAALFHRERTGEATIVDSSLLAQAIWSIAPSISVADLFDIDGIPGAPPALPMNPLVNRYKTKDDRWIQMVFLQPAQSCSLPLECASQGREGSYGCRRRAVGVSGRSAATAGFDGPLGLLRQGFISAGVDLERLRCFGQAADRSVPE